MTFSLALLVALLAADGTDLPTHLKDETEVRIPLYATQADGFRIGLTVGAQARVSLASLTAASGCRDSRPTATGSLASPRSAALVRRSGPA